jgi:hypothetical protein
MTIHEINVIIIDNGNEKAMNVKKLIPSFGLCSSKCSLKIKLGTVPIKLPVPPIENY